mmetsp:Transcript_15985/g.30339  ORF Transcript_15985/g.30339 Transcript_15985/m.30339 type:complete len:258 (+) Transcript_15985:279-1052(+)
MKDNNLAVEIVDGVPAKTLNETYLQETKQIRADYCAPTRAIALAKGHRGALRAFLDSDNDFGVIFEDDAITSAAHTKDRSYGNRSISDILQELSATSSDLNWDLLNMGRCIDLCKSDKKLSEVPGCESVDIVDSPNPMCAHSYMVTRAGAEKLMKWTWPFFAVWDVMPILMHKLSVDGQFRMLSTTPRLFDQDRESVTDGLHNDSNLECDNELGAVYAENQKRHMRNAHMHWNDYSFEHRGTTGHRICPEFVLDVPE